MSIVHVTASKLHQELLELLVPRLPQGDRGAPEGHEALEVAMTPLEAKFEEIRGRYAPGTLIIIDTRGNMTILDASSSLVVTVLEVVHHEAHGPAEQMLFKV